MTHCRREALSLLRLLKLFRSANTCQLFSDLLRAIGNVDRHCRTSNVVLPLDLDSEEAIQELVGVMIIIQAFIFVVIIQNMQLVITSRTFLGLKFVIVLAWEIVHFLALNDFFEGLVVVKSLNLLNCLQ